MSGRRPVHPRTVAQIAMVVLVVIAIAVAVRATRLAAPQATLPAIGDAAPDVDAPELVTCERTLPEAPDTEAIEEVDPVGLVSSTAVIDCPDAFDGHPVVYVGEVVGDVLQRDGGAWMLVNDDAYALEVGPLRSHDQFRGTNSGLSVWVPEPLPELEPGGPDRRGTIVRVRGVVRRADPDDGGGLTIRALGAGSATVVAEARPLEQPINRAQVVLAAAFVLAAAGVYGVERRSRARR